MDTSTLRGKPMSEYANWNDTHIPVPVPHTPTRYAYQASGTATQPTRLVIGEHQTADKCMITGAFIAIDTMYTVPINP